VWSESSPASDTTRTFDERACAARSVFGPGHAEYNVVELGNRLRRQHGVDAA
jgi:hypothetical protein